MTESIYETGRPNEIGQPDAAPDTTTPVLSSGVFERLAVIVVGGDPAWTRVESILRLHLRSGRMALSFWPIAGDSESEIAQDLIAVLDAIVTLIWTDAVDSILILGGEKLFPAGLGPFLDANVRNQLYAIPAPVMIAGPSEDDPDFGASGWEGLRTPVAMAQAIAATVAQYPTILERAVHKKNKP